MTKIIATRIILISAGLTRKILVILEYGLNRRGFNANAVMALEYESLQFLAMFSTHVDFKDDKGLQC